MKPVLRPVNHCGDQKKEGSPGSAHGSRLAKRAQGHRGPDSCGPGFRALHSGPAVRLGSAFMLFTYNNIKPTCCVYLY